MLPYACDDAHKPGSALMQIAFLAVAGYVVLTAACLGALMSLAGRVTRRDAASRTGAPQPVAPRRRRLHT
jgi:hypothetical protein